MCIRDRYYINSDTDNICYIDFESKKNIPLCSRINCGHNSDDCNAHLSFASNLCAYGDYIYVIADSTDKTGQSLYRMSFDGSEKVELRQLIYSDEHDPDASTINTQFIIYKGYGYFVCNLISSDPKKELTLAVYKMRLDSDSDMKEIFSITGCSNMMFFAGKDDEGIYIMYTYYDKETYKKCCDKDVYKRQIEDGASVAWGGSESLKETGILDAVMADKERLDVIDRSTYAVSYTHLDVYKRQE